MTSKDSKEKKVEVKETLLGRERVGVMPAVVKLENIRLMNGGPLLEVPQECVLYDLNSISQSDYQDRVAFDTPFTEETQALEEMEALLNKGKDFISMLYTYRSCSKAIPMVPGEADDKKKQEMHQTTFDIIRPQIKKNATVYGIHG
eukprot:TRINITY_DN8809_c0_g1_i1.p1 TRINITY_DN8809_c0_g1~~TRINITY_DN8809_c0_g1_i1.p1  ORF type:complete len:146 (+),score=22.11 TRINITY_DN8809_c0_g1_i1:69-506(+)